MTEIRAEMAASVYRVTAAPGDRVAAGATLFLLESMKMEIPVLTEEPGTVVGIGVAEGDVVHEGDLLAVVE
ncbi:biotin/lipoyl-binding carrier protein [Nocardiopsis composta]|uniref:Biotin carboxyl carrier protein n=1 Tax=Nocardiopsis composta TaxID=157465 RepID=A0A7W8VG70_9ACTN|nr:biotin/lipoyl-binding carrier protein [Nocardiopsis composta]MBB5434858.1 biotin carboxyl carrier protein [Nocardiopsis composta]